jgi:hypothetical protein
MNKNEMFFMLAFQTCPSIKHEEFRWKSVLETMLSEHGSQALLTALEALHKSKGDVIVYMPFEAIYSYFKGILANRTIEHFGSVQAERKINPLNIISI